MNTSKGVFSFDSDWKRLPKLFCSDDFKRMIHALKKKKRSFKNPYWGTWLTLRDCTILAILYYMGLRPKEATYLRFDDFRQRTMSFHIRGQWNKQRQDRLIPIPKEVSPYLNEYLKFGGRKSDWLFPSFDNLSKPLSPSSWKRIMREDILKAAGLYIERIGKAMPSTRSYSLRASFATRLLRNCNNPAAVQAALGHKDWRTLKHYIQLTMMDDKNVMDDLRESMSEKELEV